MARQGIPRRTPAAAPKVVVLESRGHGEPEQRRHANRPHRGLAQQAPAPPHHPPARHRQHDTCCRGTGRRRAIVSDATAVVLLVLAVFLPWNLYFGVGIPGSSQALFAVLLVVTVLAVAAVAVAGSWRSGGERFNPASAARLRLALNAPICCWCSPSSRSTRTRPSGSGAPSPCPAGGAWAWVGVAGSLLSAQAVPAGPVPADDEYTGWHRSARTIGALSMLAAVLSFGFNLYWRVRYALQSTNGAAEFGKQNIAVIATAVVYGVVALVAVLVASRWLLQRTRASRLTTVALGASALAAGILVWILPVGRDLDAFHGIAQNTSTAGVGFEVTSPGRPGRPSSRRGPCSVTATRRRRRNPRGGPRPEMACCSSPSGPWGRSRCGSPTLSSASP